MKQIKILGVLAIALTLGLAGCGKGNSGEAEHVHTFATEWSNNSSKHWHAATCEHKNVKGDEANHTFGEPYEVQKATCTEAGSQKLKCTVCDYVKTETLKALGHDAAPAEGSDAWTAIDSPSCEEVGHHSYRCSKCNQDIVVEIPALGHNFKKDADGNDVIEWTTAPTCEAAGVGGHRTCERCNQEVPVSDAEAAALGHNFKKDADGNIVFTWSVEPSCTKPGVGTKHCERCNQDVAATDEERAALGHDTELIGGASEAPAGEATVRVWRCKRCNEEFLGFKATEVTAASKQRLVFTPAEPTDGVEQSARFFGHPIGNDVPLNENGDPDRDNHPSIYNKHQTGDYFEYVFTLNAAQAAKLSTVRCYCDAKPADYLGANGIDFWANKSGDEDWTRGMYIDDNPDHYEVDSNGQPVMVDEIGEDGQPTGQQIQKGKEITDYRYVLYVDDKIQEFDPDTKVSVPNGDPRGEYVMPFTFHLKEGKNKISLRMAGGYRSQFYSFVFRPYVEPTPITVNETALEIREGKTAQITSSMTELKYASSNTGVATVDANGLVTGVKAGTATITVSKDGNFKPAKVAVTVLEKEGVITLALADGVIAPAEGVEVYNSSSSGQWYRNFKKDATVTYTFQSEKAGDYDIQLGLRGSNIALADNIAIKVNDASVSVIGTVNTQYNAVDYIVGRTALKAGSNTMVITALADNSLYLKTLKLIPAEGEAPHKHAFANPQNQTDEVESVISSCECGLQRIKWDAKKFNTTESSSAVTTNEATGVSGDTNTGIKLGGDVYNKASGTASNGTHINYNVNVPAAKTGAKLYIKGVRNSSSAASMFSAMNNDNSPSYYEKADGTWGKYEWRYKLLINGEEVEFTPFAADTEPQAPSRQYAEAAFPCTFNLKAGNNTIEIQKWGGYTLVITEFALEF